MDENSYKFDLLIAINKYKIVSSIGLKDLE